MSAETPAAEAVEEPAKKKSKKKLIIMVVAGVLVLGAAAHFTVLKPKAAAATAAAKPVPGKILSVPTQTLNLADGHLLQVGIGLQLTTTADIPSITALYPKIDSLTLKVLAPYTYHQLLTSADRNQAQHRLGKGIAALLNPTAPAPTSTTAAKASSKTSKSAKSSKATKKSKHAAKSSKGAKPAASSKATAAAAPPPQVLGTFFTTFLMQ
jgi:flagellar basal body-associated protein FliL